MVVSKREVFDVRVVVVYVMFSGVMSLKVLPLVLNILLKGSFLFAK